MSWWQRYSLGWFTSLWKFLVLIEFQHCYNQGHEQIVLPNWFFFLIFTIGLFHNRVYFSWIMFLVIFTFDYYYYILYTHSPNGCHNRCCFCHYIFITFSDLSEINMINTNTELSCALINSNVPINIVVNKYQNINENLAINSLYTVIFTIPILIITNDELLAIPLEIYILSNFSNLSS